MLLIAALTYPGTGFPTERLIFRREVSMEHRGIPFALVRTLAPSGWKWTVKWDHKEKFGEHGDRNVAIQRAKAFIDGLVDRRKARPDDAKPASDEA